MGVMLSAKKIKMTDPQRLWLEDFVAGRNPYDRLNGQSEHGGATRTVASLFRRGWIDAKGITEVGRAALLEVNRHNDELAAIERQHRERRALRDFT